jgi:hypothetical protein
VADLPYKAGDLVYFVMPVADAERTQSFYGELAPPGSGSGLPAARDSPQRRFASSRFAILRMRRIFWKLTR